MVFTLTTSGAVILKAGKNVSVDLVSGTTTGGLSAPDAMTIYLNEAEAEVGMLTNTDWIAAYSTLATNKQKAIDSVVGNFAAIGCISYDRSGYTVQGEADSMINVLRDVGLRILAGLKEIEKRSFMDSPNGESG